MGHKINECRFFNNLCLVCESAEHQAGQCPHSQQIPRELTSALVGQQKLTMSGPSRPMVPFHPRQPLPPQQQIYEQAQKVNEQSAGLVRGKGKAYTFTVDQADALGEIVTGIILSIPFLHMCYLIPVLLTSLFRLSSLVSMIYPVTLYTGLDNYHSK